MQIDSAVVVFPEDEGASLEREERDCEGSVPSKVHLDSVASPMSEIIIPSLAEEEMKENMQSDITR